MNKQIIHSEAAPAAMGTYSQAVKVGGTIYLSGQIPLEPQTMDIVEGDFKVRVRQVFKNLSAVLAAANADLTDIVKLNIYLTDLGEFANVNAVMSEFFEVPYPARAAIGVASLPKGVDVEIDGIAVV
jgi:reactive intermediate/imine deaminase